MLKLILSEGGSACLWVSPFPLKWETCTYIRLKPIAADYMFTCFAELTK